MEDNLSLKASYQEWINSLKNPTLTINKNIWEKFASSQSANQRATTENLAELIDERVKRILGSYEPPETDWEKWKGISPKFDLYLVQEWKDKGFSYETTKEWIDIGLTVNDADFVAYLRDEINKVPEEVLNIDNQTELRKQFEIYTTFFIFFVRFFNSQQFLSNSIKRKKRTLVLKKVVKLELKQLNLLNSLLPINMLTS